VRRRLCCCEDGLDTPVFSGGIGESADPVRARIREGLGLVGIELYAFRNAAHAEVISTGTSRATVRVIRTDEEPMIATSVSRVIHVDKSKEGQPR
jgi:acetate kinase